MVKARVKLMVKAKVKLMVKGQDQPAGHKGERATQGKAWVQAEPIQGKAKVRTGAYPSIIMVMENA